MSSVSGLSLEMQLTWAASLIHSIFIHHHKGKIASFLQLCGEMTVANSVLG